MEPPVRPERGQHGPVVRLQELPSLVDVHLRCPLLSTTGKAGNTPHDGADAFLHPDPGSGGRGRLPVVAGQATPPRSAGPVRGPARVRVLTRGPLRPRGMGLPPVP